MIYAGIIGIILVGTLLHFTYGLSHQNKFIAVFSAVNESTWEHIKICMTATFIWCIICGFVYGWNANLLIASALCLATEIFLIPVIFYTYTAFTKKTILLVDIISFCVVVICAQLVFFHFLNFGTLPPFCTITSVIILIAEIIIYSLFTFFPPNTFFFKDPITGKYGIEGHPDLHNHAHHHKKKAPHSRKK